MEGVYWGGLTHLGAKQTLVECFVICLEDPPGPACKLPLLSSPPPRLQETNGGALQQRGHELLTSALPPHKPSLWLDLEFHLVTVCEPGNTTPAQRSTEERCFHCGGAEGAAVRWGSAAQPHSTRCQEPGNGNVSHSGPIAPDVPDTSGPYIRKCTVGSQRSCCAIF